MQWTTMLCFLLLCLIWFWILLIVRSQVTDTGLPKSPCHTESQLAMVLPRGYYTGVNSVPTYLPYLEPTTILAGLAFIAFVMQTLHAIYRAQSDQGLLGNLLGSLLPTKHRKFTLASRRNAADVIKAIEVYDLLNRKRKKKRKFGKPIQGFTEMKTLVPVETKSPEYDKTSKIT